MLVERAAPWEPAVADLLIKCQQLLIQDFLAIGFRDLFGDAKCYFRLLREPFNIQLPEFSVYEAMASLDALTASMSLSRLPRIASSLMPRPTNLAKAT